MDTTQIKAGLTYFINIVTADIEELERVALDVANIEADELARNGGLPAPTTSPFGINLETKRVLKSRLTIPLTMVCFSVIDVVGKLIEKHTEPDGSKKPSSSKTSDKENSKPKDDFAMHAQKFFKELANKDDLKNSTTAKLLQVAYRHSLAHAFLPASTFSTGYAVSYTKHLDGYTLFADVGNERVLNVKYLTEVTKVGLIAFKNRLGSSDSEDILSNYEKMINDNSQELSRD